MSFLIGVVVGCLIGLVAFGLTLTSEWMHRKLPRRTICQKCNKEV